MDYIKEITGFKAGGITAQIAHQRYQTYTKACRALPYLFPAFILPLFIVVARWQKSLHPLVSIAYGGLGVAGGTTIYGLFIHRCRVLKHRYAQHLGLNRRNTTINEEERKALAERAQSMPLSLMINSIDSRTVINQSLSHPVSSSQDLIQTLPADMRKIFISFLDIRSTCRLAIVSKAWQKTAQDEAVWKQHAAFLLVGYAAPNGVTPSWRSIVQLELQQPQNSLKRVLISFEHQGTKQEWQIVVHKNCNAGVIRSMIAAKTSSPLEQLVLTNGAIDFCDNDRIAAGEKEFVIALFGNIIPS
jgi:hypothetical protein